MQVTISYHLTEAGRKAALLAGATPTVPVLVTGEVTLTSERLALLHVPEAGPMEALNPRPGYGGRADLDTYHVDPESLLTDLVAQRARYLAKQAEVDTADAAQKARERERDAAAIAAYLADPKATADTCSPLRVQLRRESAATVVVDTTPELLAEMARRQAVVDAWEAEAKAKQQAIEAERAQAKREYLEVWLREHGTPSQQERYAAGKLPEDELMDGIKDRVFAWAEGESEYQKLTREDACDCDDCPEPRVKFASTEAETSTAAQWERMKALRSKAPEGAEVELREHTGVCDACDCQMTYRHGVRVKVAVGPFTFHREFSAT